jgi:hypothetical protein
MISSLGSIAFSNNGNFGSLFENLVNVVNSNDCLEFGCGITMGSNFVSFGFSKLNIFLVCLTSGLISVDSSFISDLGAFAAIIFDDNSYNLSSSLDSF